MTALDNAETIAVPGTNTYCPGSAGTTIVATQANTIACGAGLPGGLSIASLQITEGSKTYTNYAGDGQAAIKISRRFVELGNRTDSINRTAWRFAGGFKGDIAISLPTSSRTCRMTFTTTIPGQPIPTS